MSSGADKVSGTYAAGGPQKEDWRAKSFPA